MPSRKLIDSIRAVLAGTPGEPEIWMISAARIVLETAIIYALFLAVDYLIVAAIGLVFRPEMPFAANVREGVKILSTLAVAVGYVLHVLSSLRHRTLLSRLHDQPEFVMRNASLKQLADTYMDKIQVVDELVVQLRQQSLKSAKR
jgi:hypothetical protein